jgi:hypothetical protein
LGALGIISIFSLFIFTWEGRIYLWWFGGKEGRRAGFFFTSHVNVTIFLHDCDFSICVTCLSVSLVYVCVTPSHLCFTLLCFASLSPLTQLQHPHATNCRRIEFRLGSFTLIPKTTAPHGTKVAVSIGGLTALIEIVCFIATRCNASLFQHALVCEGGFIRLIFSLS